MAEKTLLLDARNGEKKRCHVNETGFVPPA